LHESAKSRNSVQFISIIADEESSDETESHNLTFQVQPFPDEKKMTIGRSWHFAIGLGDKINEKDVYVIHSRDPLAMRQYSWEEEEDKTVTGFLPCHFLCM
jgi:hypothetical protein